MSMFNIQAKDSDKYFKEVETKLTEETNYNLEIAQALNRRSVRAHTQPAIPEILSRIFLRTRDFNGLDDRKAFVGVYEGEQRPAFGEQTLARRFGFYMFQVHQLRKVHADPHPGNFLVDDMGNLIAIDFGCIKEIPESFYVPYFELAEPDKLHDPDIFYSRMVELEILMSKDTPQETAYFSNLFREILSLLTQPFQSETFDFADESFFGRLAELGEKYANDKELRKMNMNRGSKHFIYINRTFFGLFSLLHDLKATVETKQLAI